MTRNGGRSTNPNVEHGSHGKRRAVSPATSEASVFRVARDFEDVYKKVKREPVGQNPTKSRPVASGELDVGNRVSGIDSDLDREPDGLVVAPEAVSADQLHVLGSSRTNTRVFQGAIDDVVDCAFTTVSYGEPVRPGQAHINHVLQVLRGGNIPGPRIGEVAGALQHAWRRRMAQYIGESVASPDELRDAINVMTAALPFRPGHNGYINCMPELPQDAMHQSTHTGRPESDLPARTPSAVESKQHHIPSDHQSCRISRAIPESSATRLHTEHAFHQALVERPEAAAKRSSKIAMSPQTGEPREMEEPDSAVSNAALLAGQEDRIMLFKERFPRSFDAFFHHLQRDRLQREGCRRKNPKEGEAFEERARAVYNELSREQRKEWRGIHKKLQEGDSGGSDEEQPRKLLANQNILALLAAKHNDPGPGASRTTTPGQLGSATGSASRAGPAANSAGVMQIRDRDHSPLPPQADLATRPSAAATSSHLLPLMIPFARVKHVTTATRVMFLTVALPGLGAEELARACLDRFGKSAGYTNVEPWSEHVWTASFANQHFADKAKGQLINVRGVPLMAEHLCPKPPFNFICDFSGVDVDDDEVAFRVAQAFASRGDKPVLRKQEAWKLYPGRQFTVSFGRASQLFRFFVPMRTDDSAWFTAYFAPINPTAPCAFCREPHGRQLCAHAKVVPLPDVAFRLRQSQRHFTLTSHPLHHQLQPIDATPIAVQHLSIAAIQTNKRKAAQEGVFGTKRRIHEPSPEAVSTETAQKTRKKVGKTRRKDVQTRRKDEQTRRKDEETRRKNDEGVKKLTTREAAGQCGPSASPQVLRDDELVKKILENELMTRKAAEDCGPSASVQVFRNRRLVKKILEKVWVVAYRDGKECDGRLGWTQLIGSQVYEAHASIARCRMVSRAWNKMITKSLILQRLTLYRSTATPAKLISKLGVAGQPGTFLRSNELLGHLYDYTNLPYRVTSGQQCEVQFFRSDITLYRTSKQRAIVQSLFLTMPPVTIFDVLVTDTRGELIGFDDDGERCVRGSRLATHSMPGGFTMGDLLEIAIVQFEKRRQLYSLLFKSMDQVKARRLAMISA